MTNMANHPAHKWIKKTSTFLLRLSIATILVSAFFVITQDFHIFPGLYSSLIFGRTSTPSQEIEALTTRADDGQSVSVWRMQAKTGDPRVVALIFHGNAEYLDSFVTVQSWLRSLNITSYSVEYRGYNGRDSGWPSENGFYLDGEAALKLLLQTEAIEPQQVLVLGSSIGTGPAAYIAQKYQTGTLVLLSPYSTLVELVAENPLLGYLTPFLKYRFPNSEYIRNLNKTCVVVAHGEKDFTIPLQHSVQLKNLYRGSSTFTLLTSASAGHNGLLAQVHAQLALAIQACLTRTT